MTLHLMTQIMQTSNEFRFQQQQQLQYCFNAAAHTNYPSSPTSTLSRHDHAATVATEEEPPLISDKSTPSPSPKGCLGKTIRRRSRASKKTPVTLLNADVKDFRALVQRFTGCRTSEISFATASRKGPVNLNFAASQDHHHFLPAASSSEIGFHSNHSYQPAGPHGPYNDNFNWRTETGEVPYKSRHSGDRDLEHHDMLAMNYMQAAADFQSLDDIDLKLDDMGTSLHELIGDINA